jgi:putative membrane protein insertion efficiency factor
VSEVSDNPGKRLAMWPRQAARWLIRGYQLTLSPYVGRQCRFYPTCSQYALEAIECHGLGRGGVLALRRLGRCHPFHPGGVDLVPAASGSHHHEEP